MPAPSPYRSAAAAHIHSHSEFHVSHSNLVTTTPKAQGNHLLAESARLFDGSRFDSLQLARPALDLVKKHNSIPNVDQT